MKKLLLIILLPLGLFEINEEEVRCLRDPWIGVPIPVPATLC